MSEELKSCCATLYESDLARMLLGDSFHPGGLRLTRRLGEKLGLRPGMRVLDVASGKGESAIFLAQTFGCEVVGIDFGPENARQASARAAESTVGRLVSFHQGDAEKIDFPEATFDAIICECAFCTFPDKHAAASEFVRVLKPGGRVGMSDLTRAATLPAELTGLLAWVACIADARPVEEYASYLESAGIGDVEIEPHDEALAEMVRDIQGKLLGAELMSKLKKLDLGGIDFTQAKTLARAAADAVRVKTLGYAIVSGQRS
jgi:ubiquinone/menaquinone biosynthesis C-methylase UbiE